MSAHERFRAASQRLLERFGSDMTFRRYRATKNKAQGSQSLAAEGALVVARACLLDAEESRDRGAAAGDQVLLAYGPPFPQALSDRWTVDWGQGERKISGPVAACQESPGGPVAYYQAAVKSAGSSVEPPGPPPEAPVGPE